jgi:SH3-like domain-containing protein
MNNGVTAIFCLLALLLGAGQARALDYGAVASPSAILYDSPSAAGKKLYVISRYTPLERVVTLSDWVKVRTQDGSLGWVEKRALGATRYVVVTDALATVRQRPDSTSPVVFEARRQVALEFMEDTRTGWIRVRQSSGASGYVKATAVWGD